MPSVSCVHFSQLIHHYVTYAYNHLITLSNLLECQVSRDDTNGTT